MRPTVLIFFYLIVVFSSGVLQTSEPGHLRGTQEAEPRIIDFAAVHGTYLGYGFGIHGGDLIYPRAFDELKPRFVRMEFGPRWDDLEERIPSGASIDDLERYIERNYNGDAHDRLEGARYAWEFLKQRDIRIVKIHFEIPYHNGGAPMPAVSSHRSTSKIWPDSTRRICDFWRTRAFVPT